MLGHTPSSQTTPPLSWAAATAVLVPLRRSNWSRSESSANVRFAMNRGSSRTPRRRKFRRWKRRKFNSRRRTMGSSRRRSKIRMSLLLYLATHPPGTFLRPILLRPRPPSNCRCPPWNPRRNHPSPRWLRSLRWWRLLRLLPPQPFGKSLSRCARPHRPRLRSVRQLRTQSPSPSVSSLCCPIIALLDVQSPCPLRFPSPHLTIQPQLSACHAHFRVRREGRLALNISRIPGSLPANHRPAASTCRSCGCASRGLIRRILWQLGFLPGGRTCVPG